MTDTSLIDTAIDKLVTMFDAATTADVLDGPQVSSDWPAEWVAVGTDGPVQEEEDAARSTQVWKGLGARIRDEDILVTCSCGYSSGNATTAAAVRAGAKALFQSCVAALRGDPGLALGSGTPFVTGGAAAVTDSTLRYVFNSGGLAAVFVFTVAIPVRLQP